MKDKTDEYKNIQSPAWLVPPQKPNRNLPPMERKSATAAVLPRPHGVPIMRLAQKKFDKEEWKEAIDSLRKNPNLRIKIGAPHPEVEGLFFIQYNRQYVGGEYWGTKQRLSDFRKANNISSQKSRKKRMERDPEFKAKVMANLDRLIARKESLSEEEREQMDKEAARRWQARNNPNGEYSRRYYQANKMRIAKAQKARRRKLKEEKEAKLLSSLSKLPLYYLKKPDGRKAKPTREQRMAANAKKHQEKKRAGSSPQGGQGRAGRGRGSSMSEKLRVLVACEYSGTVRDAFNALGHEAMSCDLLPTDKRGHHYEGDVRDVLEGWMPVSFLADCLGGDGDNELGDECSVCGSDYRSCPCPGPTQDGMEFIVQNDTLFARPEHRPHWDLMIAHPPCTYLSVSGIHWNNRGRGWNNTDMALEFVRMLMAQSQIPRIALENPVSIISSRIRKPDQIIQPWQFGHDASKSTCLWLKGLPPLQPTRIIEPRVIDGKKRWANQTDGGQNKLGPSEDRWKIRSTTYDGIAAAMAVQWGGSAWNEGNNEGDADNDDSADYLDPAWF